MYLMVCDYKVFDYLKDDPMIMFEEQSIGDLGEPTEIWPSSTGCSRRTRELAFEAIDFHGESGNNLES